MVRQVLLAIRGGGGPNAQHLRVKVTVLLESTIVGTRVLEYEFVIFRVFGVKICFSFLFFWEGVPADHTHVD